LPEQASASVDKFQEMAQRWSTTQEELWAKWFEMLKGMDFSQPSDQISEAFQNPMKAWQDATQKVLDAQADWMKIWTGSGKEE